MNQEDDKVEMAFKDLPKAPAFTQLERKAQERLIREYVADFKRTEIQKEKSLWSRNQSRFSLAAGFILVISGLTFASSQDFFNAKETALKSPSITQEENIDSQKPNALPEELPASKDPKSEPKENKAGISDREIYDSGSGSQTKYQFVNNLGFDYEIDEIKIRNSVKLSDSTLKLSDLPATIGKCAIELGINKILLGIDSGKFDGQSVVAYFVDNESSRPSIWITTKSCIKITEIK